MNITAILSTIYSKISASTSTEEVLILSKIAEKIKIDNIRTVLTYGEMYVSGGSKFATGTVFFVENEEKLYYYSGSNIIPLLSLSSIAFTWGNPIYGKLGDNTTISRSSPVSVVGGFTDWVQLSGGRAHSLGVRSNGTAWAWGRSTSGQLGDNTTISRSSPVSVVGGFTDWVQVSGGYSHSLGLRSNGTAWAWGSGSSGQLGANVTTDRSSPVSVVGGYTDWVQVSAGETHSLGIRANGTAWAWGSNTHGRLGDNTTVSSSSPVSVVGGYTDWVQLSAGQNQSLGVRANGTAWAWGNNTSGRLGDDTTVSRSSPVSVVGGFTDWIQVSGGNYHSLGLRANGTAWAWGNGGFGRLGDNTAVSRSSPVSVVGGFTDWIRVSGGYGHSVGMRSNGTVWAWGGNQNGKLGDNTATASRSSPVSVVGGFTDWVQVSAGNNHNLAIRTAR
jgi:alpha-tubulin suppressor-like RCC1 family protein